MQTIRGVKVTDNQAAVYSVLKEYGPLPDHALVPLMQHVASIHQSSSGIRTRRAELTDAGLVSATGETVKTASNRSAVVFAAV